MNSIKMVDLHGQYLKIKNEIDKAVIDVIEKSVFINGDEVALFREELENFLNIKHVIPCGNGTDALQIALMALNLNPGDEVITSNFTFIASVEVIKLLRLTPVLVDVNPDTFNIDPHKIEQAITPKTKAIIPIHLFGQCADMDEITRIAKQYNLYIIEDAAQSFGAKYTFPNGKSEFAGNMGTIGCTSFFPSKNLGCFGDGGALYTNDSTIGKKLHSIINHGMTIRYYYDDIGVNSRLDTIQAAVLRIKLKYLHEYNQVRQKTADLYDNALKNCQFVEIPIRNPDSTHIFHQYTLKTKNINRNEFRCYLESKAIPAMIYYPVPIHLQKAYSDNRYQKGDFPNSEKLCESVISLPMHTELTESQIEYITDSIVNFK